MIELEESGLTRSEILHNKVGDGVALREDQFFQFLKTN